MQLYKQLSIDLTEPPANATRDHQNYEQSRNTYNHKLTTVINFNIDITGAAREHRSTYRNIESFVLHSRDKTPPGAL